MLCLRRVKKNDVLIDSVTDGWGSDASSVSLVCISVCNGNNLVWQSHNLCANATASSSPIDCVFWSTLRLGGLRCYIARRGPWRLVSSGDRVPSKRRACLEWDQLACERIAAASFCRCWKFQSNLTWLVSKWKQWRCQNTTFAGTRFFLFHKTLTGVLGTLVVLCASRCGWKQSMQENYHVISLLYAQTFHCTAPRHAVTRACRIRSKNHFHEQTWNHSAHLWCDVGIRLLGLLCRKFWAQRHNLPECQDIVNTKSLAFSENHWTTWNHFVLHLKVIALILCWNFSHHTQV